MRLLNIKNNLMNLILIRWDYNMNTRVKGNLISLDLNFGMVLAIYSTWRIVSPIELLVSSLLLKLNTKLEGPLNC